MSDILIVNKHGKFHTIPERLFGVVASQGGRKATAEEQAAYEVAEPGIEALTPAVEVPPTLTAPWADYDSLNADQVVARLKHAPPVQIAAVTEYEMANKKRKTVLDVADDILRPV